MTSNRYTRSQRRISKGVGEWQVTGTRGHREEYLRCIGQWQVTGTRDHREEYLRSIGQWQV